MARNACYRADLRYDTRQSGAVRCRIMIRSGVPHGRSDEVAGQVIMARKGPVATVLFMPAIPRY